MEVGAASAVFKTKSTFSLSPIASTSSYRELFNLHVSSFISFHQICRKYRFLGNAKVKDAKIPVTQVMKMDDQLYSEHERQFSLTALSPLDGRYRNKAKDLSPYLSEYGLIYFRVLVEVKWLLMLSQIPEMVEVPTFSDEARSFLEDIVERFDVADALEIKNIEKVTNHDVKAVEYFLKPKSRSHPEIAKVLEFFHFSCTSEDITGYEDDKNLKSTLQLKSRRRWKK